MLGRFLPLCCVANMKLLRIFVNVRLFGTCGFVGTNYALWRHPRKTVCHLFAVAKTRFGSKSRAALKFMCIWHTCIGSMTTRIRLHMVEITKGIFIHAVIAHALVKAVRHFDREVRR